MEKRNEAQRIAVIEQCVMTETALRFILNDRYNENSGVHFFKDVQSLTQTMNIRHVTAIIFHFPVIVSCDWKVYFFQEAAYTHPNILRIILANSGEERDLITQLVPFHLHGVLNKSCGRETLQEQLFQLLEQQLAPLNEPASRKALYGHRLSSIEQTILRYIACGHSLSEIAVQLGPEYQNHSCPQIQCDGQAGHQLSSRSAERSRYSDPSPAAVRRRCCGGRDSVAVLQGFYWQTSIQVASVNCAILSGEMRTALWIAPAAGKTSGYCFSEISQ